MEDDQFEWDPEKNAKNIAKHKISFVAAKNVFFDPNAYDGFDLTSSHDEDRFFITGQVDGKILTVVYTNRGDAYASSLLGPQLGAKWMNTIVARVLPDGSLVEVMPDGSTRPLEDLTDWAAIDSLTDEQILAAALDDPDARPIVEGRTGNIRRGPHPRFLRMKLRLSREEFASRYNFPLAVLEQWEAHKSHPDEIARAYLKAIAADPDGVAKAVAAKPQAAE
jgi:putative transcriptional regulator